MEAYWFASCNWRQPKRPGDLFASGTTREQLEQAANKIIKKGKRVTENVSSRIQTFEKKITINGKTDKVRIIVDSEDGNRIITMFPARQK